MIISMKRRYTVSGLVALAMLTASLLTGCSQDEPILLPAPTQSATTPALKPYSISSQDGDEQFTSVYHSRTVDLRVALPYEGCTVQLLPTTDEQVDAITDKLEHFTHLGAFSLLPEECRTTEWVDDAEDPLIKHLKVALTGIEDLDYGYYVLPIKVQAAEYTMSHYILVNRLGDVVPLGEATKRLPPDLLGGPERTEPMKMVAYVETNNYDIRNYGNLVLTGSRLPVFDFIVLFAANMNYDAVKGRRYISFNDKLQPIVQHPEIYIKPLTDRGIKVIVDILPNHQGVGYNNFQSYEEALDFAKEAKMWTDKLGIDGWDVDEEYAEYWKLPTLETTEMSALWMVKAFKEVMPDKLITHYEFNSPFSADLTDEDGKSAKDYVDYSWSDYNVTGLSFIDMPKLRYGNRSIEANSSWQVAGAASSARGVLSSGLGLFMYFNLNPEALHNGSQIGYLSEVTKIFYGESCDFVGPLYKGPAK